MGHASSSFPALCTHHSASSRGALRLRDPCLWSRRLVGQRDGRERARRGQHRHGRRQPRDRRSRHWHGRCQPRHGRGQQRRHGRSRTGGTSGSGGTSSGGRGGSAGVAGAAAGGRGGAGGKGTGGASTGGVNGTGGSSATGGLGGTAPPVTPYIVVDQFGYLPDGEKVAVIRDPQTGFDAAASFTPGSSYALVNAATGSRVYTAAPTVWNAGATDVSSGDKAWWFTFTSVTTAGDYYVLDIDRNVRSYPFTISDHVYRDVLKQAVRMLFYQRAGQNKDAAHAGAGWTDVPASSAPCKITIAASSATRTTPPPSETSGVAGTTPATSTSTPAGRPATWSRSCGPTPRTRRSGGRLQHSRVGQRDPGRPRRGEVGARLPGPPAGFGRLAC